VPGPVDAPVEAVTWAAYRIPTDAPETDGTFAWDATTMVVVHVRAAGHTGLGWTYAPAAAGHLVGEVLAGTVTGRCALDVTGAYHAMHRAVRNIGRPGVAATAISAVDVALWDLKARLLGVRLARLLGVVHDEVPVYGSGCFTNATDELTAAQAGDWVRDRGIRRVKMKIAEDWGRAVERDLARVALARRVIGPEAELYVDANGGYTRKQAIRVAARMAEYGVSWFEEPVSSDDLDGLREVRAAVAPDVAAGEYGYDLPYFQRMCGAVDCLQADVSRCGGITEWVRVAALAAARNLDISAHCCPYLHLDAALATPRLRHLEWFHDHVRVESTLLDGVPGLVAGALRADLSAPGHGLAFKEPDAQRFRIA
jgi:L-alanine-DL-glutamate epimerase-like enolase superfamily enzyme